MPNFYGSDIQDFLPGTPLPDELYGGANNDVLFGGAFTGVFTGTGASANDPIVLSDASTGPSGDDVMEGGSAGDVAVGGDGDDSMYGGDGDESGTFFFSTVFVRGGMYGGDGDDNMYGGNGDDDMFGGADDDCMEGGADEDFIAGGEDNDHLWGGKDEDCFYFAEYGKSDCDTIYDFWRKEDQIYLEADVFDRINGDIGDTLKKKYFEIGKKADDKKDRIIYNDKKGIVYYDENGSKGSGKGEIICKVGKNTDLKHKDFELYELDM